MTLRRVLREPLVHFLLLGAALLVLERRFGPPARDEIVLDPAALAGLRADHLRRTGVPPTPDGESRLVARYVDDEVLYREALALGLDRGDVIVRRRLVQKMELLAADLEPVRAPTDAELAAWLGAHPDRWAEPARYSLVHVFVDGARPDASERARGLRARLATGADPATLGDPFLRGHELRARTQAELAGVFGPDLARAAAALPVGAWSAPLRSSYGLHLVRLTAREAGHTPALATVRDAVARDWAAAEREALDRAALDRLRAHYTVRVPAESAAPSALAAAR